ncbi:hypothetical protein AAEO50_07430 [Rossellomorea oryzaecorticis]|uniref:Uncharacterized protein n=1 Tax=Rossellomorea oryzaecorticis TaxID=1396505 RepID=A0ABU9K7P1_9BACI
MELSQDMPSSIGMLAAACQRGSLPKCTGNWKWRRTFCCLLMHVNTFVHVKRKEEVYLNVDKLLLYLLEKLATLTLKI